MKDVRVVQQNVEHQMARADLCYQDYELEKKKYKALIGIILAGDLSPGPTRESINALVSLAVPDSSDDSDSDCDSDASFSFSDDEEEEIDEPPAKRLAVQAKRPATSQRGKAGSRGGRGGVRGGRGGGVQGPGATGGKRGAKGGKRGARK